jgi:hypothetical protein
VTGLLPLDVACPPPPVGCGTPAGRRCFWRTPIGKVRFREPHAARVTAARAAASSPPEEEQPPGSS